MYDNKIESINLTFFDDMVRNQKQQKKQQPKKVDAGSETQKEEQDPPSVLATKWYL